MLSTKQFVYGRSKAILSVLLLVSSTSSFPMEFISGLFSFGSQRKNTTSDQGEFFRLLHKELDKIDSEDDKYKLREWMVESCIQNMPEQLRITYNYLESGDIDDPKKCIPSKHRMLLVGPPGASKSCTAEAIAQRLGYPKKVIGATALRGEYRGHTAINIRNLFNSLKSTKSHLVLIINELHKLFANYREGRTDDAENVTAFLEGIDYFEKHCHNIITIGTANWANKVPPEMKSRYRRRIIFMPLPTEAQLRVAFEENLQNDDSIVCSESVDPAFIANFCADLKDHSYRDIQYLIDDVKGATYLDGPTFDEKGRKILDKKHFRAVLDATKASDDVAGYEEAEEMTEAERHQESIDLQDQYFVQQGMKQMELEIERKNDKKISHFSIHDSDFLREWKQKDCAAVRPDVEKAFVCSLSDHQRGIYKHLKQKKKQLLGEKNRRQEEKKEAEAKKKAEEEEQKKAAAQTQPQSKKKDSSSCGLM